MRAIGQCFNKQLESLCQSARLLGELTLKVNQQLPKELAHCKVGSFHKGCLILLIEDPVWASQLRFHLPALRDSLRKEAGMYQLSSIKIQLTEPLSIKKPRSRKVSLSARARTSIAEGSQAIDYEPLKQALLDLSEIHPHPPLGAPSPASGRREKTMGQLTVKK